MFFNNKINYPSNLIFWLICFCFSSSMALIFQKVILPMWPEMHAGYGLLKNDAIEFHQIALKMANDIKMKGGWALVIHKDNFHYLLIGQLLMWVY